MPELKVGLGLSYTAMGANDNYYDYGSFLNASANTPLDSLTVGLGGTYTIMEGLDATLAFSYTHCFPKSFDRSGALPNKGEYRKQVFDIAYGVGYKAF
jgi:long-subunit fatty acid transport protein